MADAKTELRELSVAITIGLLKDNSNIIVDNLYDFNYFLDSAKIILGNSITKKLSITNLNNFDNEMKEIIHNGFKLGSKIFNSEYFEIDKNSKIDWVGNDTQKGDPIDIKVDSYGFSLKEDSFILKNMGLYQLLNTLTGSSYPRGLHIFNEFAPEQYDSWFSYAWKNLVSYLKKNKEWKYENEKYTSHITLDSESVLLNFNNQISKVPILTETNEKFTKFTNANTREKVFSKWIKEVLSSDEEYIKLKKVCSETAGENVCTLIKNNYSSENVFNFFQIHDFEYFYAKSTSSETTILKVPSVKNFNSDIEFIDCTFDVPSSQLNIITVFKNKNTRNTLEFRNECRFSHGQFNGTPEAKMYVKKETSLTDLYSPLHNKQTLSKLIEASKRFT